MFLIIRGVILLNLSVIFVLLLTSCSNVHKKKWTKEKGVGIKVSEEMSLMAEPLTNLEISVQGPVMWADWESEWHRCADGLFAIGFSLKIEPRQHDGDDTSVNAVKIYCGEVNRSKNDSNRWVTPNYAKWGTFTDSFFCEPGKAFYGFRLTYESHQGEGDDTGLNGLHMVCRSAGDWRLPQDWKKIDGYWPEKTTDVAYCPSNTFINGIKSAVEPHQGSADDTAMNSVKFLCSAM